nr:filamentous hemagglutinin N-terminal domain-containing protein [Nostoc sp. DedSLP05]
MTLWGWGWHRKLAVGSWLISSAIAPVNCVLAQITPDNTLPNNSSVIREGNTFNIVGGTQAGGNLFHSFGEFSVPTGNSADFNNAVDIQNIISRVTGGSASNIDGLIKTNGTANLFLINPNGIIFGQSARLDLGGSFIGSTASSLKFRDGTEFSATMPPTVPLLTISVPVGLQYGKNPASILNQSQAINNSGETVGLQVHSGKTLALVGGDVELNGGNLQALGGRVELGGLAAAGTVELNFDNNLQLSFPANVALTDILLTNASAINVVAENRGSIAINARNLDIVKESSLVAGIDTNLGEIGSKAGDITLNATGAIKFEERSQVINSVNFNSIGNGGNIIIQSESILFRDGSTLWSLTNGRGNTGDVILKAKDSVTFEDSSGTFTFVNNDAVGNGPNIIIQAQSFSMLNGSAFVSTSDGEGNSGNVTIDVNGAVTFAGTSISGYPSSVFTNSSSIGKGGNITIRASSVSLHDGANLDTSTSGSEQAGDIKIETSGAVSLTGVNGVGLVSFIRSQVYYNGVGSGGNINIKASSLSLQNGTQINSNTLAQGNAGNIILEINGAVSLAGVDREGNAGGIFSSVEPNAIGNGGNINIQATSLSVTEGARLSASTVGQGNAGNINVNIDDAIAFDSINSVSPSGAFTSVESGAAGNAGNINLITRSIRLDNQAAISAITTSGNGGDINLQVQDILLLRRNSKISTSAGTVRQGGNGGNITINAPNGFIIAVPQENSDITANAFIGKGGRVDIQAFGIFSIQPRQSPTFGNDITASSELGIDGTIELNTPDVDPSRGLVELPTNPVDASNQIAQGCTPRGKQTSSFVATGRGGLPDSPNEMLGDDAIEVNLVTLDPKANRSIPTISTLPPAPVPARIVEAQGFVIGNNGEVILTASVPTATPNHPGLTPQLCHVSQQSQ